MQRGTPDRPPLLCGGRPGEWAAGTYGAIGALAALRRARLHGVGDLIDVAALDALMFSQPLYPVTWFQIAGVPFRPVRSSQLPNLHPTADGYVALQTTTGQQWLDFCTMIGRDDWYDDERLARGTYRTLHRPELEAVIEEWTTARTTAEIVELATLLRDPGGRGGQRRDPAALRRLSSTAGGSPRTRPASCNRPVPYRLGGEASPRPFAAAPTVGRDTERHRARPATTRTTTPDDVERGVAAPAALPLPLAGLRVVDLTAFWAGPVIGYACGVLGAEVIHVESTKHPDGIRLNTTRPMSEPQWWEWCPMFHGSNTNKLDVAIELDTERGRELFLDLVAHSDVVLDNFSPRVLEQLELDQNVLLARNPQLVVLRAPAYGITGPWRERLAYAPTIEAQAGIAWVSGFPDRGPEPPSGVADAMGGAHATVALLLALEHRRRTGRGMYLECPMVGAALNLAAEQIVEHSAYGRLLERRGNRSATNVPQGVYRTADVDARRGAGSLDRHLGGRRRPMAGAVPGDAARGLGRRPCACHRGRPSRRRGRARRRARGVVRDPHHRGDRRAAVGRGRAGRAGGTGARARPVAAGGVAAPVRTGRAPGHRHHRLHRRAVPSRQRSAGPQPPARATARRAQPRRAHAHPRAHRRRGGRARPPTASSATSWWAACCTEHSCSATSGALSRGLPSRERRDAVGDELPELLTGRAARCWCRRWRSR